MNESLGNETCQLFGEKYGKEKVAFVPCDVRSKDSVDHLWSEATSLFGEGNQYVDLWVNNAGVMGKKDLEMLSDTWCVQNPELCSNASLLQNTECPS